MQSTRYKANCEITLHYRKGKPKPVRNFVAGLTVCFIQLSVMLISWSSGKKILSNLVQFK